jgi:hypothetical protein
MSATIQHHRLGISWHESGAMARAAHAVRESEHVWLIDPFDDPDALSAVAELGEPSAVIQLLDRHNRDCAPIADRLGVPLLRLPATVAGSPFEVVKVVSQRWWTEKALWWPGERALIVPEAVGTADAFRLGRELGVHPMLRLTPPGSLQAFSPDMILVGHGPAIETGGAPALSDALANARLDTQKLLLALPSLIKNSL